MSRASEKIARELAVAARKERRKQARARLKKVREDLARGRLERKERMRAAVQSCKDARARLRVRIEQQRRELQAAIAAERAATRGQCQASRDATREQTMTKIAGLRKGVLDARTALRLLSSAPTSTRKHAVGMVTSAESRAESDHAVRVNLPKELVIVFDKVRREIHGSPRRSRTEAFLEWAQENPARVYEIQHAAHDKWLRDLEREERQLHRGDLGVEATTSSDEWGG